MVKLWNESIKNETKPSESDACCTSKLLLLDLRDGLSLQMRLFSLVSS